MESSLAHVKIEGNQRYSWQPSGVPSSCACSKQFSVNHALSCPKGGFTITRHNEIRDITANLLTEIYSDVCVEPELQPVSGEELIGLSTNVQDGARLDIACNSFAFIACHSWMYECLIPMQNQTNVATATESMNLKRRDNMNNVSEMSNTPQQDNCLTLNIFMLLLEVI